ncbi:hypothetical protein RugamoR64_40180 [Duganella rhizosphaerae]|uniref:hypothetical protein n=1 Tax=Duganella rhizosphaerae TaxID=2885763 RepID=UPI0030EA1E86
MMMRNFPALALILLALACGHALALDDTPTVAPHFQLKGEDFRPSVARPNPVIGLPLPARRTAAEAEPARPEPQAPNPRAVATTVLRALPAPASQLVEKPRWKLR